MPGTNTKMQSTWPKLILFGDSITQICFKTKGCLAALLADFLQRRCDVINRGFSGYNTRWCKLVLPKVVTKDDTRDVCLVTLFLGANDSADSNICHKQHVPLEEFKQNLTDMVSYLLSIGISKEKIVIITPPPTVEARWQAACEKSGRLWGKYNEPIKDYVNACVMVSKETDTVLVDLYTAMVEDGDVNAFLFDGRHLSNEGGQLLFDLMKPMLQKLKSDLPVQFPYWSDVDNQNPYPVFEENDA